VTDGSGASGASGPGPGASTGSPGPGVTSHNRSYVNYDQVWTRAELAVVAALLATAFVIGSPILGGGWLTYLDNPAHIAEIRSLASDGASGWSRIGFAGLSLDTLHSPLFWRGLAAIDRLGVDIGPIYAALTCLGVAAPAIAVFVVARRRLAVPWSAGLAYVVLIQRTAIVGTAAATGGMWTFYLASAALILLADRLARPTTGRRDVAAIAALLGFIGLTHMFVLVAAVILVGVHAAWTGLARRVRPGAPPVAAILRRDALGCALAAAASAVYWLPTMTGAGDFQLPQDLPPSTLGALLVAPTDVIELLAHLPASALPGYLESVPMVGLLVAGLAGAVVVRRRDVDPVAAYGAGLAVTVIVLLVSASVRHLDALGPVSWRFLYFVRIGAALAAIPILARLAGRFAPSTARPRRVRAAIGGSAAIAAIASGWLWGAPLRHDVPDVDGAEMTEVRALWAWLRATPDPDGGRVYLQDTFGAEPHDRALIGSHVLALTLDQTGVEPLGPFYGVIPAATVLYVRSEFGLMFGGPTVYNNNGTQVLNAPIGSWDVSRVVTSTPAAAAAFRTAGWDVVHEVGRFVVFRYPHEPPHRAPVGVLDGRYLAIELDGDATIAHAYHRYWRVARGPAALRLERSPSGRMAIAGLRPGRQTIILEYRPPPVWPVSVTAWLVLAVVAYGGRRFRLRSRHA